MKRIIFILILFFPIFVFAAVNDSDGDGLSDEQEINFYYSDPYKADTDDDGYDDKLELINGYSPIVGFSERLINIDQDNDGLNDGYELALQTDLKNLDSDSDGHLDGEEFISEYDPRTAEPIKLEKQIKVNLSEQYLEYYLGPVRLNKFVVSTGKAATPTPRGEFTIEQKKEKAWSQLAGLWMPWWLSFKGIYAIHELPEWPDGSKEGSNHLGIPVSHGCIRLGIGPAKQLYDWTTVDTRLIIY